MVSFFKKYWGFVLIILILIAVGIYLIRRYRQDVDFNFSLGGNLEDLLGNAANKIDQNTTQGIGFYIDVPLTTVIKNKNAAAIVLNNLQGTIAYNGQSLIQTKPNSAVLSSIEVAGRSSTPVTDNVQLLVNDNTIKFFQELIKGNKPAIKYNLSTMVFGKLKQFTNTTNITKS